MSERGSDRETGERPSGEGREGRPDETRRFSNAPGRRYSSRDDSNGRGGRETIRSAKGHERGAGRDPPRVSRRVAVGSSREPREGARDASAHHAGVFERRELGAELGEDARVDHGRARAEVVLPLGRLLHCEGGWRVGRGTSGRRSGGFGAGDGERARRVACEAGRRTRGPGATGVESAVRAGVSDERARRLTNWFDDDFFWRQRNVPATERCLTSGCERLATRWIGRRFPGKRRGENRRWSDDARARATQARAVAPIDRRGPRVDRERRREPPGAIRDRTRDRTRRPSRDRRARSTPRRRRSERRGADDLAYCRTYRSVRNRSRPLTGRDF